MGTVLLENQKVWFDGYDLTGQVNTVGLDYGVEAKDATTLGNDTRVNAAGLKTVAFAQEGFWNPLEDSVLFSNVGAADKVVSFCQSATEGDTAYMFKSIIGAYSIGAETGELLPFSLSAGARGDLIRSTLMANKTAVAGNGAGTARQLGALSASQKIYAALHVLSTAGGDSTLDVTIESDSTNSFSGGETTQITFSQVTTALGAQWQELSGAETDTWWRPAWNVAGSAPDFDFVLLLGIK